jgi:hypothetical protein
LVPVNVSQAVVLPRITKPEIQALDVQQMKALLKAARDTDLYALWVLMATTGVRVGEALGLSLSFNPKGCGSASAMDTGDGWGHDGAPWTLRPNSSTPCVPSATRSTGASSSEPMPSSS